MKVSSNRLWSLVPTPPGEAQPSSRLNRAFARRDHLRVALVGYTNAGKSSLMHALIGGDVLVADKLFDQKRNFAMLGREMLTAGNGPPWEDSAGEAGALRLEAIDADKSASTGLFSRALVGRARSSASAC
jgi:predicted GTPase